MGHYLKGTYKSQKLGKGKGFGSVGNWPLRGARVWESELTERFWNQRGFCLRNY